jgi:hypothetical protein
MKSNPFSQKILRFGHGISPALSGKSRNARGLAN